ncbi:MAG TPA: uroporphyrinogen decarboxylase family protein [Anaerolineales bacterium]|nr:uroporphyrinogen decarboxylase family protein [Anaerolineales bacterium]
MTTHRERIQACFNGETTDRTPIALWRHFPEEDQNPETLAAATIKFQQAYGFDIVKVTPASSFAVKDWGVEDEWQNNPEGSREYTKRVIQKPQDWEALKPLDPTAPHLAAQLQCLRLVREGVGADTPVIQTIFNPMSQAKNLAGNDLLLEHAKKHPEALMKGLETIAQTTVRFIEAAHDAGIDGIFYAVQHAQASLLELDEYKSVGLPYDQQVLESVNNLWCNLLHLHGKDVYFSLLRLMNFQIVNWHDRETYPSLSEARSLFRGATLCGGIRQDTLYKGNQAQVKEEAKDAIKQTKGKRFILGTGCVVYYQSAHENIMTAIESTR